MSRTPGLIVPSAYSSKEELETDLRRRGEAAGFTPFEVSDIVEDVVEHYGVKGMKWGVHKSRAQEAVGLASKAQKIRKDPTKDAMQKLVASKGGLHKVSDSDIQVMIKRMEMEKKYKAFIAEDSKRRAEGAKAVFKILGEVGKFAAPIVFTALANRHMNRNNSYRTRSYVSRNVIDVNSPSMDVSRR